jgi:MYXO-CTERM domain-containing protein
VGVTAFGGGVAPTPANAAGDEPPAVIANPYEPRPAGPVVLDLSDGKRPGLAGTPASPYRFEDLDELQGAVFPPPSEPGELPPGWVQRGSEVVPEAVAQGAQVVSRSQLELSNGTDVATDEVMSEWTREDFCAFPEAAPASTYPNQHRWGAEFPRRGTIYLNFVGGVLQNGGENSAENQSTLARTGYMYPPWTLGETKAIAVAQSVANDWAQWAMRVVYLDRPSNRVPFVMVMVGGSYQDTVAGPSGGVAPSADCEDYGQRNVCYSFTNGGNPSATGVSITASQEIGHTYGLGHTRARDSVMAASYAPTNPGDLGLSATCTAIVTAADQGNACRGVNLCHCGADDQQNDVTTISAIYALAGPDMAPPEITITAPADGATFPAGSTFDVTVDVWDDYGGYGWSLTVIDDATGEPLGTAYDYDAVREFAVVGLPEGRYRLLTEIEDQADQVTTDEITVTIGPAGGGTGGETSGGSTSGGMTSGDTVGTSGESDGSTASGSGGSDAGTSAGATSADTSGSAGATSADATEGDSGLGATATDEGCGCRSDAGPRGRGGALLLLLLVPALARRRRVAHGT